MNKVILPIYNLTPFTMLDYPDHTSCIVWFSGCNFRCPYCHNPEIVKGKGKMEVEDVLNFLHSRKGLLDGVVLSGGEATVYKDIIQFAHDIKSIDNFDIKLDTNGTRPDIVKSMIDQNLVDYIALDYKAPECKYKKVTGTEYYKPFKELLSFLCSSKNTIPFEVRTTVHTSLLDEEDLSSIINDLDNCGYKDTFYIQNYFHRNHKTLGAMEDQKRLLNIEKIPDPRNFNLEFRNFK